MDRSKLFSRWAESTGAGRGNACSWPTGEPKSTRHTSPGCGCLRIRVQAIGEHAVVDLLIFDVARARGRRRGRRRGAPGLPEAVSFQGLQRGVDDLVGG